MAIITGRSSRIVERRATELGIKHVIQGREDKLQALKGLLSELELDLSVVAYMGDDLPELALFARCGVKLAVADGAPELRAAADWVSARPGGHGAVREAAELILKARGSWERIVDEMGADQA